MKYLLFEDEDALDLQPFTLTRPVYELRVGITTIREKWEQVLGQPVDTGAHAPLDKKFQRFNPREEDYICINGKFLPTPEFPVSILSTLTKGVGFYGNDGELIAFRCSAKDLHHVDTYLTPGMLTGHVKLAFWDQAHKLVAVRQLWDIFNLNGRMLRADFETLTKGRTSDAITDIHTRIYKPKSIFLEPNVKLRAAILNAEEGPIYIAEGAEVQEGAIIKGPVAIGPHAVVAMGAKIRPDTTIGPYCKVGGEVSNCVFFAYSNKAHDGFLGNSVVGEWCNLGAGTNCSNLKNNYSTVKIYSHHHGRSITTGLQFCGLFMGDHSKCGINTMFNTGTVVGVGANVFGGGFPPKFVPSFAWGLDEPFKPHEFEKAAETAERVMARRNIKFDKAEREILAHLYKQLT